MPNDVPDWSNVTQAQLVGALPSLTPLGDVTGAGLSADNINEAPSVGNVATASGVIASFKAAAGQVFALVGAAGAALVGTVNAVNPAFGQATVAGHMLLCGVTADAANGEPTTAAAGWVKAVSFKGGSGWSAIWVKPNCGNGEAAPGFTSTGSGIRPMEAQLLEFSGGATAAPTDKTGSGTYAAGNLSLLAGGIDSAFGDLAFAVSNWNLTVSGSMTFIDTANNSASVVQSGTAAVDVVSKGWVAHFAFAIIPAGVTPQPLGVEAWDYDQQATSLPATGTNASIVLAAVAGKAYRVGHLSASLLSMTAATHVPSVSLIDGATTIWVATMGVQAAIGSSEAIDAANTAHKGSINTALTFQFSGNAAGGQQGLALGVYLR